METANLSFVQVILTLAASFSSLGLAFVIGWRIFPQLTWRQLYGKAQPSEVALEKTENPADAHGRLFPTDILGLEGNIIRYRDGSFGKAYRFAPANTLFDDERQTEQRIEELKLLLKFEKPQNTIIQFRFNTKPDDGRVLKNHLRSRNHNYSDQLASLLQTTNLAVFEEALSDQSIKTQTACVWIRVPTRHRDDKSILARFLPTVFREIKSGGFWGFFLSPVISGKNAFAQSFLSRELKAEIYCREQALRVFQSFEANFPKNLALTELPPQEVFDELFVSHRREHLEAPTLPKQQRIDIRRYLTSVSLDCEETKYVIHNGSLVSIISLKLLPNGFVTADTMRYLTATRNLLFPHEIIVDLTTTEKIKAKKDLQKRIDRIERSRNTWFGFKSLKKDAVVIKADLENLLEQVEGDSEEICQIRLNIIVYGGIISGKRPTAQQLKILDDRCDEVISCIRKRTGADAIREDAARQRAIYPRMLTGELSWKKTGQELVETADSVIAFVPTETNWCGSNRPHSIFTTPSGTMFGLDLYDRSLVKSPTVIVTAASGEGKSFLASMLITDIRAHRGQVKVRVMDYRYSFKPICRLFNGRHIEFNEQEPKPINIWNYPGIETGKLPSKRQLAMVLTDILILSKMPKSDAITSAIAATVIDEVYKMATARNGAGRPKFQPTLGHFLDVLKSYHWSEAQKARADELYLKLNIYRKDPWLNAPTHPDYDTNSMFDVFELSSIATLDEKIRESVGFRISAQIMQEIGEESDSGQKTPILFICDEVREINKHFPAIQELMAEASVTGRKEGLVTILFSQAYEHFTGTPERPNVSGIDLVKNSGVKIIGKQIGGFEQLAEDCELSKETIAAVRAINNQYGSYTQWVMVIGSGNDKIIEMAEVHASPAMLWANTNDTNEANVRRLLENLRPDLPLAYIVSWLAQKYPRGLTAVGLNGIFDEDLAELTSGGSL
ncbi:MAG TPA: hypothetical protein PKY82_07340 [Pyrinomonadaceae bacterium]|nr:hypothetical protein [Pyrinomonadaceae bacterium]